jgi:YafQ family addiction module toxin component
MRRLEIEKKLQDTLKKIFKKDRKKYKIIWKKINEILVCSNVEHYKNLKFPLNEFKRVHIDCNFVLIFKYNKSEDIVLFYDLDHHDKIYNN